jgi:hypothetical protein
MSSAYGHAIQRLGGGLESTKAFCVAEHEARLERRGYGPLPDELVWRPGCTRTGCPERPEYVTRYFYVTGRAGRVTDRLQYVCQAHAEAFAKKYGLELTP